MVGRLTLDQLIVVRIHGPQYDFNRHYLSRSKGYHQIACLARFDCQ